MWAKQRTGCDQLGRGERSRVRDTRAGVRYVSVAFIGNRGDYGTLDVARDEERRRKTLRPSVTLSASGDGPMTTLEGSRGLLRVAEDIFTTHCNASL